MTREEVIAELLAMRYEIEGLSDRSEIALYQAVEMIKRGNCDECKYKESLKQVAEGLCGVYGLLR